MISTGYGKKLCGTRLGNLFSLILRSVKRCKGVAVSVFALMLSLSVQAAIKMPWLFSDRMVLQRDMPVAVWGEAEPRAYITVKFESQSRRARADETGRWMVCLSPLKSSALPGTLVIVAETVSSRDVLEIGNILVGEVWLAAGQSNMHYPLKSCTGGREAVATAGNSSLRLLNRRAIAYPDGGAWSSEMLAMCTKENYFSGVWTEDSPASAADFSGVAYWFGTKLQRELNVPVGLINVSVGGTTTEAFTSRSGLSSHPLLRPIIDSNLPWYENPHVAEWPRARARDNMSGWFRNPVQPMPRHPFEPAFLFESAIEPLVPMAFAGVIWYQGESNATDAANKQAVSKAFVRAGFETLITDWRRHWKRDFPFYYVQLPGMGRPWEIFREMQLESLSITNTGMAVTIDLGDPRDVHPRNKRPVGERLALWALAKNYGRNMIFSGPLFTGHFKQDGSKIQILFAHCGDGLRTSDGRVAYGFEIAGEDGVFHPASVGLKESTAVLSCSAVERPVMARYAWAPFPECNVVNSAGLPMSPFRTNKNDGFYAGGFGVRRTRLRSESGDPVARNGRRGRSY